MNNPELYRNFWLEFSQGRLIFAVVVLASLLFFLINLPMKSEPMIYHTYTVLFFLISGFWGIRRASASLSDEISEGTWDAQRMSAISAWQMSWGKLFGATSYTWLVGMTCLSIAVIALFVDVQGGRDWLTALVELITIALIFLIGQAVGIITALSMHRLSERRHAPRVMLSYVMGLLVAGVLIYMELVGTNNADVLLSGSVISWWVWQVDAYLLNALIAFVLAVVSLFGIERCMRVELCQPYRPGFWTVFAVVLFLLMGGFVVHHSVGLSTSAALAGLALSISVFLMYVSLLAGVPEPVQYRMLYTHYVSKRYHQAAMLLPLWVQSLVLVGLTCLYLFIFAPTIRQVISWEWGDTAVRLYAISLFLFVCRDVVLVHLIRSLVAPSRFILVSIIILLMAYILIPGIFGDTALPVQAMFIPSEAAEYGWAVLFPLIETFLLCVIWYTREPFRLRTTDQ